MPQNNFSTVLSFYKDETLFNKLYIYLRLKLFGRYFQKIEQLLPLEGKILDLGSGFGLLSNYLLISSPERNIIGIDNNLKRTKVAQRTTRERKNVNFIFRDIKEIEKGELRFDSVVMTDFLHHLNYHKQEELLEKISQSLKKRGCLIIGEVMEKPRWKYFFSYLADLVLYPFSPKCFYRTTAEMERLLKKLGFKVEIIPYHQRNIFALVIYSAYKVSN